MKASIRTLRAARVDVYPAPAVLPRRWLRPTNGFPLRKVRPVAGLLSALFILVIVGLLLLAGYQDRLRNPFSAYLVVMPGHSRADAVSEGAVCTAASDKTQGENCILTPTDGPFKTVKMIVQNGQIVTVNFTVRTNTLFTGDLERLWGKPIVYSGAKDDAALLQWSAYHISATVNRTTSSSSSVIFLSVNHVMSYR